MSGDGERVLRSGVYRDEHGLWADDVLAPMWISPGMQPNPEIGTGCNACYMGISHHTHDNKAFSTQKALRDYDG